ncbi:MAG: hypothetical protein WC747_04215 [Candidatus Babeliales bacterium]|jgi:hypothetical protein
MKKIALMVLLYFSNMHSENNLENNFESVHSEKFSENNSQCMYVANKHLTPYSFYFLTKQFLYLTCFLYWIIDLQKIKECLVCCDACNNCLDCFYTYGFFSSAADKKAIKTLQKLMRIGNKKRLISFLVKLYNAKSMTCNRCGTFSGWHGPNQNSVANTQAV